MKEVITLLLLIGGVFAFHFIYEAICNFFMKIDAEMPAIYESKEEDLEKIKKVRERESSQMYSYLPSNIWFKHDK